MLLKNISEGQVIKNYKGLCSELEVKPKTGKSKQLQLEDFQRYFKYSKKGHSFIIEKIYDKPMQKEDHKNNVFGHLMQLLILDYLISTKRRTVIITRQRLLIYIHMINPNYTYCSIRVPALSKYTKIDEKIIYDFLNSSGGSFKSSFETALSNLRKKSLIMYEKVMSVCLKNGVHRQATEDEKEEILQIETELVDEMGFSDISKVRISSKWHPFKENMKQRLKDTDFNFYYSSYKITVNRKYIEDKYNSLLKFTLDELKRCELKDELNETVMDRLIYNAKNRKQNSFTSGKMSRYRSKDSYINDNEKLINLLINSDAEWIGHEIDEFAKWQIEEDCFEDLFG